MILVLRSLGEPSHFPAYEVEIVRDHEAASTTLKTLEREENGELILALPAGLDTGEHSIQLYGLASGERIPLELYSFRVNHDF